MRIDHLIDGKLRGCLDYFETVNPANQAVLAEVARGGGGKGGGPRSPAKGGLSLLGG